MLTRYPHWDAVLDLRFRPVANRDPRAFTAAQIEQFDERGFTDPVPLFDHDALDELQRFFRMLRGCFPSDRDDGSARGLRASRPR